MACPQCAFTAFRSQTRHGYFLTPAIQLGLQGTAMKFDDADWNGDIRSPPFRRTPAA
jgi:hypothetical protein